MKVLVLNPPFFPRFSRPQRSPAVTKSGTLYYPIWLAYATGVLEKSGFQVKFMDACAEKITPKEMFKQALEFNPKLIVLDTSTPSIFNDVNIGAKLKMCLPESFVILVGTHVSALPQETLNLNKNIDAVAREEYDYTLRDLAFALKNNTSLDKISGISFRKDKIIIHNPIRKKITNLNDIPFVSAVYKKHLNVKSYFFAASNYPEVQIFTGRGCPFGCFFCVYPQLMHGGSYRLRSPENIVREFKFIEQNLPEVKEVIIEDDTFSINQSRVEGICELLIKEKNKLPWNANVRPDLKLKTMQKMKEARCRLLIIGFESADQNILNNINKGIKIEQMESFFKNSKKAKLLVHAAFMAGNPGETKETLEKTFSLAKKMMPDTVQFFPLMVYPGTKAFQWAKKNKILRTTNYRQWVTKDGLHNCVIDLPNLSAEKLVNWCDRSRRRYYLNLRYIFYKLKQILLHPKEAKRTLIATRKFKNYLLRKTLKVR